MPRLFPLLGTGVRVMACGRGAQASRNNFPASGRGVTNTIDRGTIRHSVRTERLLTEKWVCSKPGGIPTISLSVIFLSDSFVIQQW